LVSRRRFLQVGLAGTALLVAARWLDRSPPPAPPHALDAERARVIEALVPAVLGDALPSDAAARKLAIGEVVAAFDRAVAGLSPAVQGEIADLLGLLHFAPTRVALAGLTSPWEEASVEDVSTFLTRWRTSRFDLMRAGYQALTQLIQAAWYGNPRSWGAIGYPGPPFRVETAA
jgi:hypothetical protein